MIDHDTTPSSEPEDAEATAVTEGQPRRRRRWRVAIGATAGVVLLLAGAALWVMLQIDPPGGPGERVTVEIAEGTSASKIASLLDEKGVITSARVFRLYTRVTGAGEFQAGIYRRGELRKKMAMGDVVDVLESGPEIEYQRLTVPEGLTLAEIADRVGRLPGRSADAFLQVAASGTVTSKYQEAGSTNLEGLLFPDTYYLTEDETEEQILARMVTLFDQVADEVGVAARAQALGLTPYQAVVVASLVEEETKVADERELVSAVIHNRLKTGMLLQIDATVLYALGEHKTRVLFEDLEVDSPYNTYKNPGLPPTPIAASGQESLRAAVTPADVAYLYYVKIDEDGRHAFAETAEQHQANIAEAKRKGVR